MSEQGLAARALRSLVPSRRRADATSRRPARTVADLVREREEAARTAARDGDGRSPVAAGDQGPDAREPSGVRDASVGDTPNRATDGSPTESRPEVSPAVADRPVVRPVFGYVPVLRRVPRDGSAGQGRHAADPESTPTAVVTPAVAPAAPAVAPVPAAEGGPATDQGSDVPSTVAPLAPAAPTPAAVDAEGPADADLDPDPDPDADDLADADADTGPIPVITTEGRVDGTADAPVAALPAADEPTAALPAAPPATALPADVDTLAATALPAGGDTHGDTTGDTGGDADTRTVPVRPVTLPALLPAPGPRASAVPALLSDAELAADLGADEDEPDEPEPRVVAMTTATSVSRPPGGGPRGDALAPPWVRAALMGAEPRASATPEQAAATRALRRTFGVPQDPGPVALSGVEPSAGVAVLDRPARPLPLPGSIVGAPVPIRYRVVRRDGSTVGGAEVTFVDRTGATVGDTHAGPDGRGRFVVQQPGPYMVVAAAPWHQPGASAVHAVAGTVDVDVPVVRSASVSGTVRLDGDAVASAQLTLVQDGEVVEMVVTDPIGRFRITDLTGGEYALAVAADGCPPSVMVVAVREEVDVTYDVDLASPRAGS